MPTARDSESKRRSSGRTAQPLEDELVEEFQNTVQEGTDRLHRTWRALIITGLFGGIDVGLGIMAMLAVMDVTDSKLLAGIAFGVGLLALRLAHSELFTERLGPHRTLDLIYTAEMMTGAEAVAAGLFSRAVPAEELMEFTMQRVSKVARGATQSYLASKELVAQVRDNRVGLWESMAAENKAQAALCATDDYKEGFAAFQQKRKPEFTGRG